MTLKIVSCQATCGVCVMPAVSYIFKVNCITHSSYQINFNRSSKVHIDSKLTELIEHCRRFTGVEVLLDHFNGPFENELLLKVYLTILCIMLWCEHRKIFKVCWAIFLHDTRKD